MEENFVPLTKEVFSKNWTVIFLNWFTQHKKLLLAIATICEYIMMVLFVIFIIYLFKNIELLKLINKDPCQICSEKMIEITRSWIRP